MNQGNKEKREGGGKERMREDKIRRTGGNMVMVGDKGQNEDILRQKEKQ